MDETTNPDSEEVGTELPSEVVGEEDDTKIKLFTDKFDVFFVIAVICIFLVGIFSLWLISLSDKTVSDTEQASEESSRIIEDSQLNQQKELEENDGDN